MGKLGQSRLIFKIVTVPKKITVPIFPNFHSPPYDSIDLSPNNFRHEIFRFRARRSKNYEAYTVYMLNNFYEVAAEIWKSQ